MPNAGPCRCVHPYPLAATLLAAIALTVATVGAQADTVSFKGRTITLYVGGDTGGYDVYARLLMDHYPRHIAGAPTMTLRQMPGAGTLRAANYMYEVAPKDGTAIGTVGGGTATAALFKTMGARFDPRHYVWIGSMNSEVGLVLAWNTVPVKSIEDLFHRELLVGGGGPTSGNVVFPNVMNKVLGTQFRIISGYKSTGDIALAIERGEIEGTASYHYSSIITRNPDWLTGHKVTVLLQDSLRPHRVFPDVPVVVDLAKTDEQRAILDLVFARQEMGRPFLLPPGTPPAIGETLRRAFDAAMTDPALRAEAERAKLDLNNPMTGEEIDALIEKLYAVPDEIVAKAVEAAGANAQ
jgi:tripartite-type tricarboxylate transporter receptor subunit TctC